MVSPPWWASWIKSRISPPVWTSRFPVGSSASRTSGLLASARAMAVRCRSPPESSRGPVMEPMLESKSIQGVRGLVSELPLRRLLQARGPGAWHSQVPTILEVSGRTERRSRRFGRGIDRVALRIGLQVKIRRAKSLRLQHQVDQGRPSSATRCSCLIHWSQAQRETLRY